jgi:hypothetical protein
MKPKCVKSFWDEEWKYISFENLPKRSIKKYLISNYGRIVSYYYKDEGVLLKTLNRPLGYHTFVIKDKNGKNIYNYVHRLVAQYFLDDPREDQNQVIHLDGNRQNNYYKNLQWASEPEKRANQDRLDPGWHYRGNWGRRKYHKLTESQVKLIKRKINDPNRKTRMKMIAKRYGISVMQLYRIKSGENWSSVSPD